MRKCTRSTALSRVLIRFRIVESVSFFVAHIIVSHRWAGKEFHDLCHDCVERARARIDLTAEIFP